ncbi:Replication factor C subunit 3 [Thelohanellus kitauei]|uniref:Replication factor C subunit 3 n=1 Tax=Thelohanellus kitauei TaxID=669202 RepID=A0A0C2JDT6_THEKT|nr:Replication factor C subunit 3 [Thelohanellus kitauei]
MEADRLTKDAQQALRRTMEKYSESCRIILLSESLSPIIDPIQSRCLCVRIPSPTESEMIQVMNKVCKKENIELNTKLAQRIYIESDKNMRRALLMLETCKLAQYPFNDDQEIELPHWQVYIRNLANEMLQSQTPEKLMQIRTQFYELLSKCIPVDIIFKELLISLLPFCDKPMKNHVVQIAALYENRSRRGSKAIFHLEAFVAHFMMIYKRFIDDGIADLF